MIVAVAFSSCSQGFGSDALGREEVVVLTEHEPVLRGDVLERVVQLGVDVEHLGSGVLDDVADLVGAEPEVHRHQHPAEAGDAEERREQPGAVLADHRHPVTEVDAEAVEVRRLPAGQVADLGVGQHRRSDGAGWSGSSTTPVRSPYTCTARSMKSETLNGTSTVTSSCH